MTKIEFGILITPHGLPADELLTYTRRSIRTLPSDFTTLWIEDHFQWGETATLECLTTLSFLAAEFPEFKIGTLVLSQAYRNPALVAKMAANLQFLSGGRLILGIGAGWKEDEYHAYGYPFPSARVRLEQLEEAIIIVRSMWGEKPSNFTGRYYQIRNAYCEPQPKPPIPLLIGGGGERRTLILTARYADWWNFNSCTVEEYARKAAILRQHCNSVGRDPAEIRMTYSATVSIADDPAQLLRHSEKHIIAGNSSEVIRELEQFCKIGATHFMLKFLDSATLEHFVEEVLPHFR